MVTERIKKTLDILKIEDREFPFTGINVKEQNGIIEISMDN